MSGEICFSPDLASRKLITTPAHCCFLMFPAHAPIWFSFAHDFDFLSPLTPHPQYCVHFCLLPEKYLWGKKYLWDEVSYRVNEWIKSILAGRWLLLQGNWGTSKCLFPSLKRKVELWVLARQFTELKLLFGLGICKKQACIHFVILLTPFKLLF